MRINASFMSINRHIFYDPGIRTHANQAQKQTAYIHWITMSLCGLVDSPIDYRPTYK